MPLLPSFFVGFDIFNRKLFPPNMYILPLDEGSSNRFVYLLS